jgi:hypothetical protein
MMRLGLVSSLLFAQMELTMTAPTIATIALQTVLSVMMIKSVLRANTTWFLISQFQDDVLVMTPRIRPALVNVSKLPPKTALGHKTQLEIALTVQKDSL